MTSVPAIPGLSTAMERTFNWNCSVIHYPGPGTHADVSSRMIHRLIIVVGLYTHRKSDSVTKCTSSPWASPRFRQLELLFNGILYKCEFKQIEWFYTTTHLKLALALKAIWVVLMVHLHCLCSCYFQGTQGLLTKTQNPGGGNIEDSAEWLWLVEVVYRNRIEGLRVAEHL